MITFIRSQTASFVASVVDLMVMILCTELAGIWYGVASVIGNIAGAVTHFLLGRKWVFATGKRPAWQQALRYVAVWAGYVALSFILVVAVTRYGKINYAIAK